MRCRECGEPCSHCSPVEDKSVGEPVPAVNVKLYRHQDGDLLVLKVHGYLSMEQKQRISDAWAAATGEGFGQVVVLDEGVDLEVIRKGA